MLAVLVVLVVVVTMTVPSTSNKPTSLSASDQKVFDTQGREFDPMAAISAGSEVPVWDQINPGNTVTVRVVHHIPVGATPDHMELHDSVFSGGAKIALK